MDCRNTDLVKIKAEKLIIISVGIAPAKMAKMAFAVRFERESLVLRLFFIIGRHDKASVNKII